MGINPGDLAGLSVDEKLVEKATPKDCSEIGVRCYGGGRTIALQEGIEISAPGLSGI